MPRLFSRSPAADAAHPAFSNLFVQTEFVAALEALLATRRTRVGEAPMWAAHVVAVEGEAIGKIEFETDRARFLGHGRGIRTPMSVIDGRPLSGTVGSILDPILSLRRRVRIPPGGAVRITFSTVVAPTRDGALDLADKYSASSAFERVATLAWTQAQVQLHHLGVETDEAHLFQRLANRVLYSDPTLRPPADVLARNTLGQMALWPYGISGDLPIVLVRIDEPEDREIVRQCLRAYEYWRTKRLAVDLVILNEKGTSYLQDDLQSSLDELLRTNQAKHQPHDGFENRGGIFMLRADRLPPADRLLLQTTARAVLLSRRGTLAEQVERLANPEVAHSAGNRRRRLAPPVEELPTSGDLEFFNGVGGFAGGGRTYRTILGEGQWTPAPWINVIANPSFGFQVSESGRGLHLVGEQSGESADAVVERPRERCARRGALHPGRGERRALGANGVTHSRGHLAVRRDPRSRIQSLRAHLPRNRARAPPARATGGPDQSLAPRYREPLGAAASPLRYRLRRVGARRRPSSSAPYIVTELDEETGALFVRNFWIAEFADRVAFADLAGRQTSWTADRTEFLGRNGTLDHPAALEEGRLLAGAAGAGIDPCAALQTTVDLDADERTEICFLLGQGANVVEARLLIERYRAVDVGVLWETVTSRWEDILGPSR